MSASFIAHETDQRGERMLRVAAAQMGPIGRAESRESVVARQVALLEEAAARSAELVVFPELALTTFFPRWHITNEAEIDAFYETEMPNDATKPLFDAALELGVGFALGFAEKGETPMPTKDTPNLHTLGTAVSVSAAAFEGMDEMEKPTLIVTAMERGKEGKSFRRNLKYPGRSPHEKVPTDNFGNIAMVPAKPLEAKTTYRCLVQFPLPKDSHVTVPKKDGTVTYVWEFTTAKK